MNKNEILNLNDEQIESIVAADNGNHRGGGNNGNGQGNEPIVTTLAIGEEDGTGF